MRFSEMKILTQRWGAPSLDAGTHRRHYAAMPEDPICRPFRQLARNARLANQRLDLACMALDQGEWEAPRTSFFPSLRATMVHLLDADRWYIGLLRGDHPGLTNEAGNRATPVEFARERAEVDDWLVGFCESLHAAELSRRVKIHLPGDESLADLLLHIFMHGQHHRGQTHSMLSGTSVAPPQIDDFILAGCADDRAEDLEALGWNEDRLRQ
jgi:uncharacterized damage-inducible protein DinB